jgi:hypothetical protein
MLALKVALVVIFGITFTIALGTVSLRCAIGATHSLYFGNNIVVSLVFIWRRCSFRFGG